MLSLGNYIIVSIIVVVIAIASVTTETAAPHRAPFKQNWIVIEHGSNKIEVRILSNFRMQYKSHKSHQADAMILFSSQATHRQYGIWKFSRAFWCRQW